MVVTILKSKIHQAVVTDKILEYEGSITIDMDIVDAANMLPYEKVLVTDINNGARLETYIIPGKRGSKTICLNGAAGRLVEKGDRVIIMAFAQMDEDEAKNYKPTIIRIDKNNNIIK